MLNCDLHEFLLYTGIHFFLFKDTSGLTEDQLKCVGKNHTPVLELEWKNPKGHNSGFKIKAKTNAEVNVHLGEEKTCNETCVYRIESDLTYSTEYSVTIWTVGCGKSGMITTTCKTGVTGRMHVLY